MLSRNNLKDIQTFRYCHLENLKTLSLFANSISTPPNTIKELTERLLLLNESCPTLSYLNIEANPLIDAVVFEELES